MLSVKTFLLRRRCVCLGSAGVTERSQPRWPFKHHYSGMQAEQQREAEADPGFQKVSCCRRGSGWAAGPNRSRRSNSETFRWNSVRLLPGPPTDTLLSEPTVCFTVCVQLNFIYGSSFTKRFTATEHRKGEIKTGLKRQTKQLQPKKYIETNHFRRGCTSELQV